MQEEVWGPLGMKDSTLDWKIAAQKEHYVPHYHDLSGEILPVPFEAEGQWFRVAL
jgi:CubicO group peptidase (beta-lactamase class C family)